jgi:hypothetical protein
MAEKPVGDIHLPRPNIPMIGLQPAELPWVRMLVALLRHPDPNVPELARQALLYLSRASHGAEDSKSETHRA